jgi:hypothetical protein
MDQFSASTLEIVVVQTDDVYVGGPGDLCRGTIVTAPDV